MYKILVDDARKMRFHLFLSKILLQLCSMCKSTNAEVGKNAEDIACEYLVSKGYFIREQNWRYKHLEADIIAEKDNFLIIVEVKYRSYTAYGEPELFVNKQKQKFLIELANCYVQDKNIDKEVRFDIIAISKKQGDVQIHHIEDAFYAQ